MIGYSHRDPFVLSRMPTLYASTSNQSEGFCRIGVFRMSDARV